MADRADIAGSVAAARARVDALKDSDPELWDWLQELEERRYPWHHDHRVHEAPPEGDADDGELSMVGATRIRAEQGLVRGEWQDEDAAGRDFRVAGWREEERFEQAIDGSGFRWPTSA